MFEVAPLQEVVVADNPVIERMAAYHHEQLLFCHDHATKLKAIIAVHNTTLGPALGGTRMWQYKNELEALTDVLRLSRGMTYKNAISGLNLGGGKAVIIGDAGKDKTEALFRRFGKFVESLGGKYITAEDVGISPKEMTWVGMETRHVVGLPDKNGDPSPVTAYGVYMGMKAAAKHRYGTDTLTGKRVVVQGVGHVGQYVVKHLREEGADVLISDICAAHLKSVSSRYDVAVVAPEDLYDLEMAIYAPCALGATVNERTLKQLKCDIIAGAANNQLEDEVRDGRRLQEKNILYVPDFVINAGGVINCYAEVKGHSSAWVMQRAEEIYDRTMTIVKRAEKEQIPTYKVANKMAEERIDAIGAVKLPL